MKPSLKSLLIVGAMSGSFAIAMPAPYYTYVWNAGAMNAQGHMGLWQYSQTVYQGSLGGWVGYNGPNGPEQHTDNTNNPTYISGSGAPSQIPPPPPPKYTNQN